jgi:hypothetical protein
MDRMAEVDYFHDPNNLVEEDTMEHTNHAGKAADYPDYRVAEDRVETLDHRTRHSLHPRPRSINSHRFHPQRWQIFF